MSVVKSALAPIEKFTYMIIREAIESAKASGALIPFDPPLRWVSKPRAFLMTERLAREITDGRASLDPRRVERWERLRADISHFVENGLITWAFMRWLDPKKYEHWELRSLRPRPSFRVFGRFAEPDVFVGTHIKERAPLGAKWSLDWEIEKLVCEDEWRAALSDCEPFRSDDYTDYITENAYISPKVEP
jgi:hypothetical protein